jgi:phosphoserine phosphatase
VRRQFGPMRYWLIAIITGTFKNIADEFYRRIGIPYENGKIIENGDVDLYKEYAEEIA